NRARSIARKASWSISAGCVGSMHSRASGIGGNVMRLRDRLQRLRWMIVPLATYLAITLVLPAANGAAVRTEFVRHAAGVGGGCAVMVAIGVVGGLAVELVRNIWRAGRVDDRP